MSMHRLFETGRFVVVTRRIGEGLVRRFGRRGWPFLLMFCVGMGCDVPSEIVEPAPLETLSIACPKQPLSAAFYLASMKGMFREQGLSVRLVDYISGKDGLDAMIEGREHYAVVAGTPLVLAILQRTPVVIVSTVGVSEASIALIGSRKAGVHQMQDLRGKRVGVPQGTNAEYFFDSALIFNEMTREGIMLVDLAPDAAGAALREGSVDAAVTWNPHAEALVREWGDEVFVVTGTSIYTWTWNLVASEEEIARRPEVAQKLLRALIKATNALDSLSGVDLESLSAQYGIGQEVFGPMLAVCHFDIRLSQGLLLSLEAQARWARQVGYAFEPGSPNFLMSMAITHLAAVDPSRVEVIW